MLTELLIKKFIPDEENSSISKNRRKYGYLSGFVGIIVNLILFITKFLIGIIINSIAITADAFNNLTDVGSSIITIVGFKIAQKPADKDHPFGHGRGEYIAGLIISFMVLLVGIEFVRNSFERILHPVKLNFNLLSFILLLLSGVAKAWLGNFNMYLGHKISSEALNASSFDSFSDVVVTISVAISLLIARFTSLHLDGYIGFVVSVFIVYEGYALIKSTISPLIGEAPDPELVEAIMDEIKKCDGIIGAHQLIVHSYGAGNHMATLHAEIPSNIPVMEAHEIIDNAEDTISKKFNILLVIHMDPVNLDNAEIQKTKSEIERILGEYPEIISIHDFRVIGTQRHKNIIFDMIVSNKIKPREEKKFIETIRAKVKGSYPEYNIVVDLERDYLQLE